MTDDSGVEVEPSDEAAKENLPDWPTWWQTTKKVFTVKVGAWNRFAITGGLVAVAMSADTWWVLFPLSMWLIAGWFALSNVWLKGWLDGARESEETWDRLVTSQGKLIEAYREVHEAQEAAGPAVNMADLMDLCEEHGVPPEKLAAVIWGSDA